MNYVVTELHDGERVALHYVHLPDLTEPGFYRQQTSMDAFIRTLHEDRFNMSPPHLKAKGFPTSGKLPGLSFWCKDEYEYFDVLARHLRIVSALNHPIVTPDYFTLPRHTHVGVSAFFDAVGYDRERKTFARWPKGRSGRRKRK